MIIVSASSDLSEARSPVHFYCLVAVPNFKVNPADGHSTRAVEEIVEKSAPNSLAMPLREDCEEQKLGFISNGASQREADCASGFEIAGDNQANAIHWQDAGALRARPSLSVSVSEGRAHDFHDIVEVARIATPKAERPIERRSCHQAASFALASGALA